MNPNWKDLADRFIKAHRIIYEATQTTKAEGMSLQDLVDLGYHIKEISKHAEILQQETDKLLYTVGLIFCRDWTMAKLTDELTKDKVIGKYATAVADVTVAAAPPKRDTPEWEAFMDHLQIPGPARKLLSAHWPSVRDWLESLVKEGKPMPAGFDAGKNQTKRVMRLRSK